MSINASWSIETYAPKVDEKRGPVWDPSMTRLGPVWDPSGSVLGPVWDPSDFACCSLNEGERKKNNKYHSNAYFSIARSLYRVIFCIGPKLLYFLTYTEMVSAPETTVKLLPGMANFRYKTYILRADFKDYQNYCTFFEIF